MSECSRDTVAPIGALLEVELSLEGLLWSLEVEFELGEDDEVELLEEVSLEPED